MRIHLVGGFLGSGKTTAIIQAARRLMASGQRVGVITNDQGKYLVDTAFFYLSDIPAVEVTGGCFCCNYHDLGSRIADLVNTARPHVVFAESVGSCADIVATVVRPLQELAGEGIRPASFSVFTDARLLRRRLLGQEMPFSDDVVYIFDKQIEEAGLVVVNKVDLLPEDAVAEVLELLDQRYPGRQTIAQSSLSEDGIQAWLTRIEMGDLLLGPTPLEIDYQRYGQGEARLAWLDVLMNLRVSAGQGRAAVHGLVEEINHALRARGAGIGHLKLALRNNGMGAKVSIPTIEEPGWEAGIPDMQGETIRLLLNARVEMAADELRRLVQEILDRSGYSYELRSLDAFHPQEPKPTYRMH